MRKKEASKSSLFLLELMISIVFFAISAAGCVQIFAKAHMLSEQAEQLDLAVSIAQSLADTCRTPEKEIRYYDVLGNTCEKESAVYQAEINITDVEEMLHLDITVSLTGEPENKDVLYHLETDVYQM